MPDARNGGRKPRHARVHGKIIGSRIAHKSGIGRQGVITAFGGHGQRQITCIDALPLPNPYPQRSGRRLVEGGLFHAPEFDIDVFAQRRPDMRRGIDHMGAKPNRISGHVIRFIGMHIHLFLWKDLGLGGQIMNGPLLVSGNRLSRNTADRQQRDRQKKRRWRFIISIFIVWASKRNAGTIRKVNKYFPNRKIFSRSSSVQRPLERQTRPRRRLKIWQCGRVVLSLYEFARQ